MRGTQLIERLKSVDDETRADAFRDLVSEFQARVMSICFRSLHNREDAEDTAQDVFVDVHRALPEFREEAQLSTWIYRIALTKSLDAVRRKKRKKRPDEARAVDMSVGAVAAADGASAPAGMDAIPDERAADPACLLEDRERVVVLREAVDSLPENQRAAITLSRYEGLGNQEIARILGVSVVSVDSLIYRANGNLRKRLAHYYRDRMIGGRDD